MATPTWVSFPPVASSLSSLLHRAGVALAEHGCKLAQVTELSRGETGTIEVGNDDFDCESESQAAAFGQDWFGTMLYYRARRVRSNLHLYAWQADGREGGTLVPAVEIESQALFFTSPLYREGEWLEQALGAVTAAIGAEACSYGDDDLLFRPLDLDGMLAALHAGTLVRGRGPAFFLIAEERIGAAEIRAAQARSERLAALRHQRVGGYHMLSNLLRPA